ncbi:MAG: GNAT family N-acetyltransferase [Alphaproteobacteria bacterium]
MSQNKITIRAVEPEDHRALQALYAQPRAQGWTMQMPYPSVEMWRQRLAEPPEGVRAFVAELDGRVVGNLGIHVNGKSPRRTHAAELGMAVHDDFHGQGVGSALMAVAIDVADNWLNMRRLELTVYVDNEPAIALYCKFGFEVEGTLRDYAFRDGAFHDAHLMARLRFP